MWQMERREILANAAKWLEDNHIGVNPMGIVIALDELGYLRDESERLKWEALKNGGPQYVVGPAPPEDPSVAPV